MLLAHVQRVGPSSWGYVHEGLADRFSAKECRERWFNKVDPSLDFGPWSSEEDQLLLDLVKKLGKKWAKLKGDLSGRSANMCKIRWHEIQLSKSKRMKKRSRSTMSHSSGGPDDLYGDEQREEEEEFDEMESKKIARRRKSNNAALENGEEEYNEGDFGENDGEEDEEFVLDAKRMRSSLPPRPQIHQSLNQNQNRYQNHRNGPSETNSSSEDGQHRVEFQDGLDFVHRVLTPYQGHVASFATSPFLAFQSATLTPISMHHSPGIMRASQHATNLFAQRNLFSPSSVPEMTPVRPGDMRDFLPSPSMALFFQTPAKPDPMMPSFLTPQQREHPSVTKAVGTGPRPNIVPVNQQLRRQLDAINQKMRDTQNKPLPSPSNNASNVPQTPLASLPPVTLFDGLGSTHPATEALDLLRRSDKMAIFAMAKAFLSKRKLEAQACHELMHSVAAAAFEERGPQSALNEIFSPISQKME